jgi:hypothetical protein
VKLVYLYGPPRVGKLTVAEVLIARTGFKLLHNHLTVNLVRSVFAFNSEPYVRLLRQFRREIPAEAARSEVDLVVTGVYTGTEEQLAAIKQMIAPVYAGGGNVFFVQLTCDHAIWLTRVAEESRCFQDKLIDPVRALDEFEGRDPFAPMPLEPTLRLDITHTAPQLAAARIADYYGLDWADDS